MLKSYWVVAYSILVSDFSGIRSYWDLVGVGLGGFGTKGFGTGLDNNANATHIK